MKKSTAEASNVSGLVPCIRVTLETMHDSAQRGFQNGKDVSGLGIDDKNHPRVSLRKFGEDELY